MAYTDALFQLGMDLTRSSTAQKEDHGQTAQVAPDLGKDFYIERDGVRCAGTHLIVDLYGAKRLDDLKHIKETLRRCVEAAGAKLLHIHLHRHTDKPGVSGAAVLAEGHMSVHSWPETGYLALDAFMGRDAKPELAIDVAKQAFRPTRVVVKEHLRADTLQGRVLRAVTKKAPAREKAQVAA
jgi:S-adenosylmethionine decarboxylase